MRKSKLILAIPVIAFAVLLQACAPEVQPEKACNFVQNATLQRVSWGNSLPVKMYIHESVSDPQFIEAIEQAARRWNEVFGRQAIVIQASSVSGDGTAKKDGRSFIYFYSSWEANRTMEQARTTIYWNGNQINEADIKVNTKNFQYSADTSSRSGKVDLESLMIHEMGHVLGLGHDDHSKSVMATTLSSGTLRRSISTEDTENLSCEYPL